MSKNYVGSEGFSDEPIVTKEKVYAFVALVVILSIAFILFPNIGRNTLSKNTSSNTKSVDLDSYNPIINSNNDTDGDGIPNWQEQIYGTNPNVADADKIPKNVSRSGADNGVSSTTNLTDSVARDIYVAGQYVKDGNGAVDPTVIANAISKSVVSLATDPSAMKFKTVDSTDKNVLRAYGNNIASVLVVLFSTNQKELDVLSAHLETGASLDYIAKLSPVFTVACNYLNTHTAVPLNYKDLHTRLVSTCNIYSATLSAFLKVDDDPVRSAATVTVYKKNLFDMGKIFTEYKNKLDSDDILFKSSEKGYIFNLEQ